MNMERQYSSLAVHQSKKSAGSDFVKTIGVNAVKASLTAVATRKINNALKTAGVLKVDEKKK